MRFLFGFIAAFVVLALMGAAVVQSGIYNVAATDKHSPEMKWLIHTTMERSVQAQSQTIDVPGDLGTEAMIQQGAQAYDQLCAACHLKPGKDSSLLRQGLNPTPPNLTTEGHFDAASHFWVIKNGIKMTGMPAWGETHADEEIWELTAFLQQLPELSEQQYAALIQPAEGENAVAGDGHDHDHSEMAGMMAGESSMKASSHHSGESSGASEQGSVKEGTEADDHYADGHTH
ncbi:cytochrome c [Marinobacter sp. M216]|uniref:Cytochrome c n=1 Tax=Marinobacter albus TaxID=3030833 RepID=A0ABT7H9B3_9GAMM|nr:MULTISPECIES: cytochrome c [unclassified Marinobacter]MBW7470793.1 cytochrome c [Marinobacter sp. F4218]MDK9556937.1 cytochrome c [Marinobacter sp. M216]